MPPIYKLQKHVIKSVTLHIIHKSIKIFSMSRHDCAVPVEEQDLRTVRKKMPRN